MHAIRSRRTMKDYTGAPIPRPLLESLLEAAAWAPTHRMTQPWRWHVLEQDVLVRYIDRLEADPAVVNHPDPAKGPAKFATMKARIVKAGAVVQATYVRHADAAIDREDLAAACAAIQNLLLAATAAGIATYWSTNPAMSHPHALRLAGIDMAKETQLGAIWLGWPAGAMPPAPERLPVSARTTWVAL